MKTTYDPPPPPTSLVGRLVEHVAALLVRALAILLPPRHR
jgi:hypothetical protein